MTKMNHVRYAPHRADGFYDVLKKNVDRYFKSNNLSRNANVKMRVKTLFMILLYFIPYFIIISGVISNLWIFLLVWCIMGTGMAGIGLAIMHDANHGSYSKNQLVNRSLGSLLNLVGAYSTNWKIQHNVLHHTYTNIDGLDEDISPSILFRFSPNQPLQKYHRFQYIYVWFFYSIMTLSWITLKDFRKMFHYNRLGLLKGQNTTFKKEFSLMIAYKLFYIFYILVIPILFSGMNTLSIVTGFLLMHFIAGLFLACIFQPAHVMESSAYPLPVEGNNMENNWAVHQMMNTANFAPKSRLFSWFVGGLNYQIEHHLFPNICHVHYDKLSVIVKKVAKDFDLPYYEHPTFIRALWYHSKMLKKLGCSRL